MKAVILAAGYATRMYPLTEDFPKPLLEIKGKPIISYLTDKLEQLQDINDVIVITNHKFYDRFVNWEQGLTTRLNIKIVDDGSTSNENRLGAIGDLNLVLQQEGVQDDVFVLGADNLLDDSLEGMVKTFQQYGQITISAYDVKDIEKIRNRSSSILFDDQQKLTFFKEKPEEPRSTLISPPFYIYPKQELALVAEYLKQSDKPDAPGYLVEWLLQNNHDIRVCPLKGQRYDIGSIETYEKLK